MSKIINKELHIKIGDHRFIRLWYVEVDGIYYARATRMFKRRSGRSWTDAILEEEGVIKFENGRQQTVIGEKVIDEKLNKQISRAYVKKYGRNLNTFQLSTRFMTQNTRALIPKIK